ncbi:hypothetical protein GCM10011391_02840 [Pullulanibacillus camelliae]|uniref:Competence protein n=1 Tax=Pullulanibacillus camelliae TaxID=1707096 RepID=A0A8J2VJS4_9BACL|nr:competence protein ComK [Pullulanibacillus camelliae]GGE27789.1 hypothetical protein GCM10011391_02840 [Pullulanibacillus camelliae]
MNENVFGGYEITQDTVAILATRHIDYATIVLEPDQQLYINKKPLQLIKSACLDGGASYDGRRKAVIHHMGAQKKWNKVPIPIYPLEWIYAFPTHAPDYEECYWIFYLHVKTILPHPKYRGRSIVLFKTRKKPLEVNVSHRSLLRQLLLTSHCMMKYMTR